MDNKIKTTAEAIEGAALAGLYAVQVDKDGNAQTENQVIAPGAGQRPVEQKSPAEWAYERIVMYIQKFEETLDGEQEVGMGFAGGEVGSLRIQGMGYFAPDLITFYGRDQKGAKTQLVQHISQLNMVLRAVLKASETEEPRRIGFELAREIDDGEG